MGAEPGRAASSSWAPGPAGKLASGLPGRLVWALDPRSTLSLAYSVWAGAGLQGDDVTEAGDKVKMNRKKERPGEQPTGCERLNASRTQPLEREDREGSESKSRDTWGHGVGATEGPRVREEEGEAARAPGTPLPVAALQSLGPLYFFQNCQPNLKKRRGPSPPSLPSPGLAEWVPLGAGATSSACQPVVFKRAAKFWSPVDSAKGSASMQTTTFRRFPLLPLGSEPM